MRLRSRSSTARQTRAPSPGSWWRATSLALVLVLVLGLAGGAPAGAQEGGLGSDVFGNVMPESRVDGEDRLINRWPVSHYQLDVNIDQGTFGVGNIGPVIFSELAASLWEFTSWLTKLTIDLFTWAFSLDLINGDRGPSTAGPASPGEASGALDPVASAVDSLYTNVLGRSWMVAAIIAAGLWGTWKALVQRRYTESAGALAISVIFAVLALWIINSPQATVGVASELSNDMSLAFLGGVTQGDPSNPSEARDDVADTLFDRHVYEPWVVLNFGGLRHCVNTESELDDGYPRPVSPYDPDANVCRDHVERGPDGHGGYASRFLAHPPRSEARTTEFEKLRDGQTPDEDDDSLGAAGGSDAGGAYEVDKSDSPAVDIQQAGGAYQRLALAGLVALLNLGVVVLLGFLSLAIILAQVLALVLLAFAPVALIIGIFPGRGHDFFKTWGAKLLTAIAVKAIYSLVLAIVLAVGLALSATADAGELGFLFAFGLQALFFWAIFIYRKQLVARLTQATTGRDGDRSEPSPMRYLAAGGAVRLATQPLRSLRRAGSGPTRDAQQDRQISQDTTGQGPSRRAIATVAGTPQRATTKAKETTQKASQAPQRAADKAGEASRRAQLGAGGASNPRRYGSNGSTGSNGSPTADAAAAPPSTRGQQPPSGVDKANGAATPPSRKPRPSGAAKGDTAGPPPAGKPGTPRRDPTPTEKFEADMRRVRESRPKQRAASDAPRPPQQPDRGKREQRGRDARRRARDRRARGGGR